MVRRFVNAERGINRDNAAWLSAAYPRDCGIDQEQGSMPATVGTGCGQEERTRTYRGNPPQNGTAIRVDHSRIEPVSLQHK